MQTLTSRDFNKQYHLILTSCIIILEYEVYACIPAIKSQSKRSVDVCLFFVDLRHCEFQH